MLSGPHVLFSPNTIWFCSVQAITAGSSSENQRASRGVPGGGGGFDHSEQRYEYQYDNGRWATSQCSPLILYSQSAGDVIRSRNVCADVYVLPVKPV